MSLIVYLDQNILSNLVKVRQGRGKDTDVTRAFTQLDETVQRCNRKGCHVFPESPYHMLEAEFDTRLSDDEWRYVKGTSQGLGFAGCSQIINQQISKALAQWLHQKEQEGDWWAGVFNRDPHQPYSPGPYGVFVRFPRSAESISRERSDRNRIPTSLGRLTPVTSQRTLTEQTRLEREFLIAHLFIPAPIDWSATLDQQTAQAVDSAKAKSRFDNLRSWGLGVSEINSFLQSKELTSAPMIDIRARLWAHLGVSLGNRSPRKSDFDDIGIMAMTLPYCHIVTTDSYMRKVVVEDLKLADSYRTLVLSAKWKDIERLIEMLAN